MGLVKPPNTFARTNLLRVCHAWSTVRGAVGRYIYKHAALGVCPLTEITVPANIGAAPPVRRARGVSSGRTMKKAPWVAWCHSGGVSASRNSGRRTGLGLPVASCWTECGAHFNSEATEVLELLLTYNPDLP